MDTLSSIDTFRQVVESGSFVAAAERLEISPATVSKRVMHVEERLGVRLLNRNTRKLSLTDSGRLYFERCKTILEDLQSAELELGSVERGPRGTLRVTCPSFAASGELTHVLAEYGNRYPEVLVDVSFEDRLADLVEEGYDVALRLAPNTECLPQALIARPVRRESFYLAASREYVRRHGIPRSSADLSLHAFVALRDASWSLPRPLTPRVSLCCRSTAGVANAVAAGIGIGPVPGRILDDPFFKERLIHILPESPLHTAMLYIVYMRRKFVSPKISAFVDFVLDSLSRTPDLPPVYHQAGGLHGNQPELIPAVLRSPVGRNGVRSSSYREPLRPLSQ